MNLVSEQLYLSPKTPHPGDCNKRFANPTALGFTGFVIPAFTLSMVLMGWRSPGHATCIVRLEPLSGDASTTT